jgi:hypothetical protein
MVRSDSGVNKDRAPMLPRRSQTDG